MSLTDDDFVDRNEQELCYRKVYEMVLKHAPNKQIEIVDVLIERLNKIQSYELIGDILSNSKRFEEAIQYYIASHCKKIS